MRDDTTYKTTPYMQDSPDRSERTNRYIDANVDETQYTILYKTGIEKQGVWEDVINKTPTADVVEVVRCKDCKYSSPNKVYGCRFEHFDTSENGERMYSDDFCSHGERREE